MIDKLSNSWKLFKASLSILSADKELLIFPILSGIGTIIITATFFLPFIFAQGLDGVFLGRIQPFYWVILFLFYMVQYTVVFFANTALVGAANIRLQGGDPTVGDGFRIASSRFVSILGYAAIAATVGLILQALSKRGKGFGRLVISLVGFAWNIATYLVVPVLAIEGVGPIEAIKRSASLLKKTWGEQIVGNMGVNAVFTLVNLAILVVFIPLIILCAVNQSWLLMAILVFLLFTILTLSGLLNSSLTGIYTAAVYQYAVSGTTNGFFEANMVRGAFTPGQE
jgi:hypothetical protein